MQAPASTFRGVNNAKAAPANNNHEVVFIRIQGILVVRIKGAHPHPKAFRHIRPGAPEILLPVQQGVLVRVLVGQARRYRNQSVFRIPRIRHSSTVVWTSGSGLTFATSNS